MLTPEVGADRKGDHVVVAASSPHIVTAAKDLAPPEGVHLRRWDGALGARIEGVDLSDDLDGATMAFIEDAFLRYQVLSFLGQTLAPADQVRFAARFGEIDRYPFAEPLADQPEVVAVTKEPGTLLNFGGVWHTDSPYLPIPPKATVLYGVHIPARGGDTMFADMHAAYDGLSAGMQHMLAGLGAVTSACDVHGDGTDALKLGDVVRVRDPELAESETVHPLVRTHPQTGRKALYMSRVHVQRFEHMTEAESAPVLDFLAGHLSHPIFTARLRWERGMVVVFDNRCVQHLALNDYPTEYREIHRVVVRDDCAPF
jgi:taurine dioxygenase